MLDEFPSLEFAASAVALVLVWRALVLSRGGVGLLRRPQRVESARARDLIGLVILSGALLYAVRVERASTWFLVASGVAIAAQVVGFYFRAAARARAAQGPSVEVEADEDGDELLACPSCGHATLIELTDTARWLGGLSEVTAVSAWVCPDCGTLTGQVEDPQKIPVGEQHGTASRHSLSGENDEALEEPTEHEG